MCGICGVVMREPGRAPDSGRVASMCRTLVHRGPDDDGTRIGDEAALAMRRLSIIDLEAGHQPIHNEDSTVWTVQNGEIYNYRELRRELEAARHRFYTHSDTEVLVHAYEEWGDDFLTRLNGMFAIAIWDRRRRRLLLARDRVGIKPLHWALAADRLLFGSEIKALTADPALPREVDAIALREYLSHEYVPTPHSILRGVNKLPPGHLLTFSPGDIEPRIDSYWDVDLAAGEAAPEPRDLDAAAADLLSELRAAVRREMVSDVPVGVFLSGGIDSSAVAAMMSEVAPGQVQSFAIGFSDASFDESRWARRVAEHLGTQHHEEILEPSMLYDLVPLVTELLDEPMADASIVPTYLLCRFTRQHVKVALGGDGGDELFAGYPTLLAHRLAGYYQRLPRALGAGLVPAVVDRLPVAMGNLSFDYRAKRFVHGARRPVGDRHRRWMGSFTPEGVQALINPELEVDADRDAVTEHLAQSAVRDPLHQVLY
ncbi:MAG TPA: asparagine synthase (glutamine-hydrolyzing), partial [Candidatus Dormibacteraeota bacterium]